MAETDYVVKMVVKFIGKDAASAVTKDALRAWRTEGKATGLTNNTWNNRLSMLRQVLDFGVTEDLLASNPTDGLRLEKSKAAARFPFTCDSAWKKDPSGGVIGVQKGPLW
jgi:site-specific recombinase XerC